MVVRAPTGTAIQVYVHSRHAPGPPAGGTKKEIKVRDGSSGDPPPSLAQKHPATLHRECRAAGRGARVRAMPSVSSIGAYVCRTTPLNLLCGHL